MKLIWFTRKQRRRTGFTILELMLSIGIFALILTAIYSIWIAILKGTRAGQKAAAEVQRARVAMRALEGSLNGAVRFQPAPTQNRGLRQPKRDRYAFKADMSGDMATLEFSSRLPDGFPGSEQYQQLQQKVRRIRFEAAAANGGGYDLLMTQWPILLPDNPASDYQPYTITLARDVTHFQVLMFDTSKGEWLDQWTTTNLLPKIVQISLGIGKSSAGKPSELVYTVVSVPSDGVGGDMQAAPPPVGIPPGGLPPGSLPPGSNPGGVSSGKNPANIQNQFR